MTGYSGGLECKRWLIAQEITGLSPLEKIEKRTEALNFSEIIA